MFISCAVQLLYASHDPITCTVYWCRAQREAHLPPGVLAQRTVGGLCIESARKKEKKPKKLTKLLCNSIVYFPAERAVQNTSGPCLLLVLEKLWSFGLSHVLKKLKKQNFFALNHREQSKKSIRSYIFETFQVSSSIPVIVALCVEAWPALSLHRLLYASIRVVALLKWCLTGRFPGNVKSGKVSEVWART